MQHRRMSWSTPPFRPEASGEWATLQEPMPYPVLWCRQGVSRLRFKHSAFWPAIAGITYRISYNPTKHKLIRQKRLRRRNPAQPLCLSTVICTQPMHRTTRYCQKHQPFRRSQFFYQPFHLPDILFWLVHQKQMQYYSSDSECHSVDTP